MKKFIILLIFIFINNLQISIADSAIYCGNSSAGTIPDTWYDQGHEYLSQKFCEPAAWFDKFFSNERSDEELSAGSFIRWRNEFYLSKKEGPTLRSQLSAKIELPKLSKRLHLLLFREDEDDTVSMLTDNPKSTFNNNSSDAVNINQRKQLNLGLRYNFSKGFLSHFSLSGGIRAGTPLKPFVKGRYRYTKPFTEKSLARFTETVYWKNTDGFGETTRFDLEHQLTPASLLRWSNHVTISEQSRGADLGSEWSFLHQLNERQAISFNLGAFGYTQPSTFDNVVINSRFRHNFYRSWLFYEVEPAVSWPKDESGKRDPLLSIILRFEVQFERY